MGDNGYACRIYLLTPVLNPTTQPERNYNVAHKRTRNIIERCFGVWKQRFPCLRRRLMTKLQTSVAIICALAVLHNIARQGQDDLHEVYNEDNAEDINYIPENPNADALLYRRAFILTHFDN